ncbi:hypothetical protein EYC80_009525 [Monilinia laxa]|uniref:Uncharacterized protein n=1 Tax=Monilinia laxa TaxID=61186 RepID=A0A5N6JYI2_MONLA|nr:hypothetical protein EYC80_009525 [Monilinia laxa]
MLCCRKVDILLVRSMVCLCGGLDVIVNYPLNLLSSVYDKIQADGQTYDIMELGKIIKLIEQNKKKNKGNQVNCNCKLIRGYCESSATAGKGLLVGVVVAVVVAVVVHGLWLVETSEE